MKPTVPISVIEMFMPACQLILCGVRPGLFCLTFSFVVFVADVCFAELSRSGFAQAL